MNESQYIQQIYDKAMIDRSKKQLEIENRIKEDMEKQFWKYLPKRLEKLIMNVLQLRDTPNIPKSQIDEAEREVSKLLSMVQTYTLPEVIDQLTKDLIKEKNSLVMDKIRKDYVKKLE